MSALPDLRAGVSVMLDTEELHVYDDRWRTAYLNFFTIVKDNTLEDTINNTLDDLEVWDEAVRAKALARFKTAFYTGQFELDEKPSRLKEASKSTASKLATGLKAVFKPNKKDEEEVSR